MKHQNEMVTFVVAHTVVIEKSKFFHRIGSVDSRKPVNWIEWER